MSTRPQPQTGAGPQLQPQPGAGSQSPPHVGANAQAATGARLRAQAEPLTFSRLKWASFTHSCIYAALLISAFAAGKPEPLTFVLGLSHGVLWIVMSIACIAAARLRVVSLKLAVAVAVLGGIGPFFGSIQFVREERERDLAASRPR